MTARCPSDLALEAHLLEPERSKVTEHVAGCARCAERLARMMADGEEFARSVFPATVEAIEAAAVRVPWWRRPAFLLPVPALAAAAAVMLLVRPAVPPDDYVGIKGTAHPTIAIFAATAAGAAPVGDGQPVAASASIRFRVRSPAGCHLWVVSTDGAGAVSRLYPSAAEDAQPAPGEADLPGGAVLDGRPGPERVYAICVPTPLPWSTVEASLRRSAPSEESVRRRSPPRGLPEGSTWSSVLLEKRT